MVKRHLKSLNAPRSWDILRKENTFTTRPNPGAHSFKLGTSINHVLKKELKVTSITKESQNIINNKDCLVNGKPVKDVHTIVGLMDVISLPKLKKSFRMTLNNKGKLSFVEIDDKEAGLKLSKVVGKTKIKGGKTQINTLDGRNILVKDDNYNTSDTIVIELPSQKIKKHVAFGEGATVMLTGGKHSGSIGKIEKVDNNTIFFKSNQDDKTYETLKKFVFVLGKDKQEIKVQ